jgi:hypothetical protein
VSSATTVLTEGVMSCSRVTVPYEKRKRRIGEGQSQGRGTSVIVGEAIVESVGGRRPVAGPPAPARRTLQPSDISVGEAVVEAPSTLREAEARRYGKKPKSRY